MAARPATYEELKDAISREYPRLSKQLQSIARFALERPHDLALSTVAAIAESLGVQPSSLIRFANALGFGGFSDMQRLFRSHLVARSGASTSYRERIASLRARGKDGRTTPPEVLHDFVADSIHGLERLEEAIGAADLRAAVRLLAGAQTIHVIGLRRVVPGGRLSRVRPRTARGAHAAARRRRRHEPRVRAHGRPQGRADRGQLPQLHARDRRASRRSATAAASR